MLCLLQEPNHPDELKYEDQIYLPLMQVYESQIAGTPKETPAAKYFWENFFKPLWTLYEAHPDGLLKGVELGPSSATFVPTVQPVIAQAG